MVIVMTLGSSRLNITLGKEMIERMSYQWLYHTLSEFHLAGLGSLASRPHISRSPRSNGILPRRIAFETAG